MKHRTKKLVIWWLRHVWRWSEGGNTWKSYDKAAEEMQLPRRAVVTACRALVRDGILCRDAMWDIDGRICGSGFFLSPTWDRYNPNRGGDLGHLDPPDDAFDDHPGAIEELKRK